MSLLDHYNNLASNNTAVRISAAEGLINDLVQANRPQDWDYSLGRLVRGLSSSRDSVRIGYSVALTELLRIRASEITIPQYLKLCDEKFEITKSCKGSEERGLLFGRLFAYEALSRSPIMERCDNSGLKLVFSALIDQSLKKVWLREPPFSVICYLVKNLDIQEYQEAIQFLFDQISEKGLSHTCEGVCVALSIPRESRAQFNRLSSWIHGDPTHIDNVELLAKVLREMPVHSSDVHVVWTYILHDFCSGESAPPAKKRKSSKSGSKSGSRSSSGSNSATAKEFWLAAVDRDLFGPDTSAERKKWGFEIFMKWVAELPHVSDLFTFNFLKTLATHSALKNSNLKQVTQLCHASILRLPETHPSDILGIVFQSLSGSPNFDKISKSETLGCLLANIKTEKDVTRLIDMLLENIKKTSCGDLVRKQWIFDNIAYVLRCFRHSSTVLCSSSWTANVFKTLIPLAYFINPKETDLENQDKLSTIAQGKIMSILSLTLDTAPSSGVAIDPQSSWPYIVFQLIVNYKDIDSALEPRVEFDEETSRAKQRAEHTLNKIHSTRNSSRHVDSSELQAFELLFAMVLLQVYASVPDAISMLDELQACYQTADGKRIANVTAEDPNLEDASDSSVILTEILISLLSKESTVLRRLSEEVWKTLCRDINQQSADLLCDILVTAEGIQGQNDLFDVGNEDDDDDDEDDDEDEEDEEDEDHGEEDGQEENDGDDDEVKGGNEKKNTAQSKSESSSASDEEFGSDYEMDEQARQRLAGTLGVPADGAESTNDDSDDESSMDDDQMSRLDVHLATIFSERRKIQAQAKEKRQENSKAKQNIVRLKGRVLDLVEIYLAENPENIDGLKFLLPLLECIKQTKEIRLAERAREILRTKLCRRTEYEVKLAEDIPNYLSLIKDIHLVASESDSKLLSLACNQASTFVAKTILRFDPSYISSILALYTATMESWFLGENSKIMSTLFIDLVNYLNSVRGSDS